MSPRSSSSERALPRTRILGNWLFRFVVDSEGVDVEYIQRIVIEIAFAVDDRAAPGVFQLALDTLFQFLSGFFRPGLFLLPFLECCMRSCTQIYLPSLNKPNAWNRPGTD